MFINTLAHAGDEHSNALEALNHSTSWYVALPVFFVVIGMICYLTWIVSGKKIDIVATVLAIVLLISGFTLFNISAAISVISLTLGMIIAGALAFLGLSVESNKPKK